jgi:hypothetical protein
MIPYAAGGTNFARIETETKDSSCRPVVEIADQAAPDAVCAPRVLFPAGGELIQVKKSKKGECD